jgi:hypothetical protein
MMSYVCFCGMDDFILLESQRLLACPFLSSIYIIIDINHLAKDDL